MVNKERLVELLGNKFYITGKESHIYYCGKSMSFIVWSRDDLVAAETIPQLLGLAYCELDKEIFDEMFEKLDDSIFEIDFKKMTEILFSLGLRGGKDENGNFQIISCKATIHKNNFIHVIRKEPIYADSLVYSGEALYNDVLEASKNWNNEE